jgi:hypothetical protein
MNPEKLIIDKNIPIYIYWHIYINEEKLTRGKNIILRQFEKIKNSGLYDRCHTIFIGYVGNINFPCETILNYPKVNIIVKKDYGYEGVTTTCLKEFCDNYIDECLILYIHNRGMSHNEDSPSEDWTLMMEYFVIEKWANSITLLEDKYTCGCELWSHSDRINPDDFIFHYSGNFWWSRSSYIKLLPYPNLYNRYTESEDWILLLVDHSIPKENFGILHRTSKNRYERGMVHSYIDRYPLEYYCLGNETPDIKIDENLFHGENCNCKP